MSDNILSSNETGSRLLGIAVLSRHGERNPHNFPITDWNVTGDALLTQKGHQQMRRLGEKIRERYDQQLFSQSEPKIMAKSSLYERCFESATETLQGLAPGSQIPVPKDKILLFSFIDAPDDYMQSYKKKYADIIAAAGIDQSADKHLLLNALHCDNVRSCIAIGRPVPEIVTPEMLKQMDDFVQSYVNAISQIPGFVADKLRPVVTGIVNDLTEGADHDRKTILIQNTHDIFIDFVLMKLGLLPDGPANQPYAVSIIFELHENLETEDRYFKLWYNKDVESFPGEPIRTATPADLIAELTSD